MAFLNRQYTAFDPHVTFSEPYYPDDVKLLTFKEYDDIYLRDDFDDIGNIDDVPVYVLEGVAFGIGLFEDANDVSNSDSIELLDTQDDSTGMPVRMIRAHISGVYYTRFSHACTLLSTSYDPEVWYTGGVQTIAPDLTGFHPTAFNVCDDWYDDLTDLPEKAASALRSLSQIINESKNAMGTIHVKADSVIRLADEIAPNQKYAYNVSADMTLPLTVPAWSDTDPQFVLYLNCIQDIDVAFPNGTMFVSGNAPNTETGMHKIIGSSVSSVGAWMVGGIDYKAVSTT